MSIEIDVEVRTIETVSTIGAGDLAILIDHFAAAAVAEVFFSLVDGLITRVLRSHISRA